MSPSVGLGSLTSKILCRHHNSNLSPLDAVGGAAFDALRQGTGLGMNELSCAPVTESRDSSSRQAPPAGLTFLPRTQAMASSLSGSRPARRIAKPAPRFKRTWLGLWTLSMMASRGEAFWSQEDSRNAVSSPPRSFPDYH